MAKLPQDRQNEVVERMPRKVPRTLLSALRRAGLPVLILLVVSILLAHWAFLEDMDALAFDFALRLRGTEVPDSRIVIVGVDDGSLVSVGPWPWPPTVLSSLFAQILSARPTAVGLDLILGHSIREYPPLVDARAVVLASALGSRVGPDGREIFWQEPTLSPEFPGLSVGHIHAGKDADGVCRSLPLIVSFGGRQRWAFSIELARVFLGVPREEVRLDGPSLWLGDRVAIPRLAAPIDDALDAFGLLPVVSRDQLLINSRGGTGTFTTVPAADVLTGEQEALKALQDRIVLVGATSYALGDHLSTAFSGPGEMPGIEIHANALDTILNRRFLGAMIEPQVSIYLAALVAGLWMLFTFWPRSRTLPILPVLLLASVLVPWAIFTWLSFWIPAVSTAFTVVLAAATNQFLHYSQLNRQLNSRYRELSQLLTDSRPSGRGLPAEEQGRHSISWKMQLLGDATEAALKLSRERSETLSFLSHELKTPLTSLQGFAELLEEGRLDSEEDRREASRFIADESARLARMLDDFLRLSRLEYRAQTVRMEGVELGALLKRAGHLAEPMAASKAITLKGLNELPEAWVRGDPDLLIQVFLNLMANAVKFSSDGTCVEVGFKRDANDWVVEVADQGPGIAEQDLPRIFEKFFRGKAVGQPGGLLPSGSGLGLAFVREVVTRHGGNVSVTSTVGVGSRFAVRLRAFDPAEATETE